MTNRYARRARATFVVLLGLMASPAMAEWWSGAGWEAVFWAPPVPPRAHYTIDYRIDADKGVLAGTEVIRLENNAKPAMRRLALAWRAGLCESVKIRVGGQEMAALGAPRRQGMLTSVVFELPEALDPGDTVEVQVAFSAEFPIGKLLDVRRAVPLVYWHPRLYWGFPSHDDFAVKVEAPPEWALLTSGRLNDETGYYEAEGVRLFGLAVGKGLGIKEASSGEVVVKCMHTEKGAECADLVLETAVDAIGFYRERFGFYPYRSLAIIPGSQSPGDGWPIATGMVGVHGQERMAEADPDDFRWITAHEIGHQYWIEYVMAREIPTWLPDHHLGALMIGLGLYADREYTRARGLEKNHGERFERYAEALREGKDATVVRPPEQLEELMQGDAWFANNIVVHAKGYAIISALEELLGEEAFDQIYRACLAKFGGRRMGWPEFQAACEEESGQDLSWFFDQWVRSNRFPAYEIASHECVREGDGYLTRIEVKALGSLETPVTVAVSFEDGTSELRRIDRMLPVQSLEFRSGARVRSVELDPEGELALVGRPIPLGRGDIARRIDELRSVGAGDRAKELLRAADEAGLTSARAWLKLGLCLYDGAYYEDSLKAFGRMADLPSASSSYISLAHVWEGQVLDLLGRREEALAAYRKALEGAEGLSMRHDQYGLEINRERIEERLEAPFVRE
ncbi:MAG: hypothetical protein JSV79_03890 [Armatimonadota bacterium]|nr:MAG: hypothetical protein JSV79_03890 [Armatimonadota bacterium]